MEGNGGSRRDGLRRAFAIWAALATCVVLPASAAVAETRHHPIPYATTQISNPGEYPHVVHGKIRSFDEGTALDSECSGTLVDSPNRSVVITAGHCVHSGTVPGSSGYHDEWSFAPGSVTSKRDRLQARELMALDGWITDGNRRLDVGAAVLERDANGRLAQDVFGARLIGFNQPRDNSYRAFGYPASAPFDGKSLWACDSGYGGDDTFPLEPEGGPGPAPIAIGCNMRTGASGGGWVTAAGAVLSVTSYGRSTHPDVVYGPYFGDEVAALVARAGAVDTGLGTKCAGREVSQLGDRRADRFDGSSQADVIRVLGGSDRVDAGPGPDRICGDGDKDVLNGGPDADLIIGGGGRDTCVGGPGKDKARGCERTKSVP